MYIVQSYKRFLLNWTKQNENDRMRWKSSKVVRATNDLQAKKKNIANVVEKLAFIYFIETKIKIKTHKQRNAISHILSRRKTSCESNTFDLCCYLRKNTFLSTEKTHTLLHRQTWTLKVFTNLAEFLFRFVLFNWPTYY